MTAVGGEFERACQLLVSILVLAESTGYQGALSNFEAQESLTSSGGEKCQ
jgi:hypothetical protein